MARIAILLLMVGLALPTLAAAQADDPLAQVGDGASNYAHRLASSAQADYAPAERDSLAVAAGLLEQRGQCGLSLQLRKQVLAGEQHPTFSQWYMLASAAYCAERWDDAVSAAMLALDKAPGARSRGRSAARRCDAIGAMLTRRCWRPISRSVASCSAGPRQRPCSS